MAHKAEHTVDLSSGALLGLTLQAADQGDNSIVWEILKEVQEAVRKRANVRQGKQNATICIAKFKELRSYST